MTKSLPYVKCPRISGFYKKSRLKDLIENIPKFIEIYKKEFGYRLYVSILYDAILEVFSPKGDSKINSIDGDDTQLRFILSATLKTNPNTPFSANETYADKWNQLVELIRNKLNRPETKKAILDEINQSRRNTKSITKLIKDLFDAHSRILVLRLDFGYKKSFRDDDGVLRSVVDLITIKKDLKRFLNNMRCNKLFKYKVGYCWKLERGSEKGYHIHYTFFFDGSKVQKDEYLASLIGDYWNTVITKGNGTTHNCNRSKSRYKKLGIGMVSYSDSKMMNNLLLAIKYLTKSDQYLHVKLSPKMKVFSKGVVKMSRSNAGRKRSKQFAL